jgi:hypothetical protein
MTTTKTISRAMHRNALMKSTKPSPSFTPSKTVAQQLEKLGHISQLSRDEILNDIAGFYLGQLFGDYPDTELLASHVTGRAHPSKEKAEAIANAYNALSLATARKFKRSWADQATVVKDSRGNFLVQVQFNKPLEETTRREVAA